jgi:phosphate transport system ATP-binding protein
VSMQADPAGFGSNEGSPAAQTDAATSALVTEATASPNGASAVSTVKLTLSFGQRAILSDIDVDFGAGKVTALLGPTGSGKTTLLRTLNRMNDKVTGYRHDGDVLLEGRSIWNSPRCCCSCWCSSSSSWDG